MERELDYRQRAANCLRLAESAAAQKYRGMLIQIAEIYRQLAEDKERPEPPPKPLG
jgi:hypothetical protein